MSERTETRVLVCIAVGIVVAALVALASFAWFVADVLNTVHDDDVMVTPR